MDLPEPEKAVPPAAWRGGCDFRFLDTGAMYRAVTLAARERGIDLADAEQMAQLAGSIRVELTDDRVLLDGRDVTEAIRKFDIADGDALCGRQPGRSRPARPVAARRRGRRRRRHRRPRPGHRRVSPRRVQDLPHRRRTRTRPSAATATSRPAAKTFPFDEVLANQQLRDQRDASRAVGALRKADDAIEVSTDGLSPEEVIARLEQIVRSKL